MGVKELLFVRERKNDNITGKAAPYSFIGLADYVSLFQKEQVIDSIKQSFVK